MTPERIADLKARCEQALAWSAVATAPPWDTDPRDSTVWACGGDVPVCEVTAHALRGHRQRDIDKSFIAASRRLVPDLAAGCLSLLAENDALRSAAPGTPLAVLDTLFTFAERECGHQAHSATHALTTVEEWVKKAKEEIAELRKALQPFAKAHITGHFLEIPRAAYTRAAAVLADPTAKKETT